MPKAQIIYIFIDSKTLGDIFTLHVVVYIGCGDHGIYQISTIYLPLKPTDEHVLIEILL